MSAAPNLSLFGLYAQECCNCHMQFAVPADFDQRRRNDHKTFYCPAGHPQLYTGKTEAEKLRERLEQAERARDAALSRANQAQLEIRARKGVATKLRKKLAHGECPCCHKTFKTLAKHMANQHPDFEQDDSL
jgi:hypothetical protein